MEKSSPEYFDSSIESPERRAGENITTYLKRLEATGLFVFHGSPNLITELEPRNPESDASDDPNNKQLAIYAYSSAALGVQRAILQSRDSIKGDWDIFGGTDPVEPNVPLLKTTPNIELGAGFLYVLPRNLFTHTDGFQWISGSPVKPLKAVPVNPEIYSSLGGTHTTM